MEDHKKPPASAKAKGLRVSTLDGISLEELVRQPVRVLEVAHG